MNLQFEYGHGLMSANLPDDTDVFIPGETVPDPACLFYAKLSAFPRTGQDAVPNGDVLPAGRAAP